MGMVLYQNPLVLLFHVLLFSLLPLNIVSSPRTEAESLVKWKNSLTQSSSLNSWSLTNLSSLCNWVISGFRGELPILAEYIGPVEIKKSEISGRGLFATKNIDSGSLLFVTKAIGLERGILPQSDIDNSGQLVTWKNLIDKVVDSARKCKRTHHLICKLSTGEKEESFEVPDICMFRPEAEENLFPNEKIDMGRLMSILDVNSLTEDMISTKILGKSSSDYYGVGLWLLSSFINHSCNPNAKRFHIGDYVIVHVSRDVKAGEELTYAYYDVFSLLSNRKKMASSWGFDCNCKRCMFEEGMCSKQEMKEMEIGIESGLDLGGVIYRLEECMRRWMVRGKAKGYLRASFWGAYSEIFGSEKLMRKWGRRIPAVETLVDSVVEEIFEGFCGGDEKEKWWLWRKWQRWGGGDGESNEISHLEKLRYLYLGRNRLVVSNWSMFLNMAFLRHFGLSDNEIASEFPLFVVNSRNLSYLGLSNNMFTGSIPESVFSNLGNLEVLRLTNNSFHGPVSKNISKLSKLNALLLGYNNFSGIIPPEIGMLRNLTYLSLYRNSLTGQIPGEIGKLKALTSLALSENQLRGPIPHEIGNLAQLQNFNVSNNQLSGSILKDWGKNNSLFSVDLSNNNFSGPIPGDIGQFNNLEVLYLSTNQLTGPIPPSIGNLGWLGVLRLSFNNLIGTLPPEIGNLALLYSLQVNNNQLFGSIPKNLGKNSPNLNAIDLSNNNFSVTGEILPTLCNATKLEVLSLSNNSLSGAVLHCLGNFSNALSVLDLGKNHFQGTIMRTFTKGCQLSTLIMNGNHFEGMVPQALAHCKDLTILDLGNNKLSVKFPAWLFTLPELNVLVLRSNTFYGPVSVREMEHPFPKLQIMDISHNEFSGNLPIIHFNNFKAVDNHTRTGDAYSYYEASVSLVVKGFEVEVKRILNIYTTIDLSSNKFRGEIPEVTGQLKELRLLNISHNSLTGHIPSSLGNMNQLEALDLSSNDLTGEIPWQLTSLSFLAFLNFSENQLTGSIPQGRQLSTFGNESYAGNWDLCGLPMTKICGDEELPAQEVKDDDNNFSGNIYKANYKGY